jgi:ankyrin repeat protein
MRLLKSNDGGGFSLTEDFHHNIPHYAILSHTWGADAEEVTFRDLTDGTGKDKAGYDKIRFCVEQAERDGIHYSWLDTCCIDKSNHSELAEAINSMFRWYQKAAICYVYLSDVSTNNQDQVNSSSQSWQSTFRKSRWFTRGWTLQELIAPRSVVFFCSNGHRLGDKTSLERLLNDITGIALSALQGTKLSAFKVEERMSWAKNRDTTREEDKAYSLLGIFDVSMSPIYGEGVKKAFYRLREELHRAIKRNLDDLSTISPPTFNSNKRLKTVHSQPSSSPSCRDSNSPNPETLIYSKDSMDGIDATTKQSLIDQLYFDKIDERLTGLTAAQGTTCRWFLTKSEYTSWYGMAQQPDNCGFLWIKGHPGTGKSTLMKLLFESAKLNAMGNSSQLTLSFFFLARGSPEEKSTTGLYCSLLHQLFQKAVDLRDSLDWMTPDGARGIQRNGWHEEALKQTLASAVQKLGSRSLMIFVDALDECNPDQATDMVCFFEELCDLAREAQICLQICFSSRHYPTIVIQKGVEVTLEDEIGHAEDIKHYIKSKLRLGKSKQAEPLRAEILEKSSGIFLWVALVLDILNREYPNSSMSIGKIREHLKKIPPKLSELFELILTRDGGNLEQLQLCLKWILFATRPLKPQELYFAIQLGLDKSCSSYWDQDDVDLDQMKTYVRSSSKGLAEVTRNKASEVQFIHESIRDYLLGKYEDQWSGVSGNFMGGSHEILKGCCLAQLNTAVSQDFDLPDPLPPASEAARLRGTISLKFPFLEYSVLNILHHANSAQQNGIKQGDFLVEFPLQQWKFLKNTLEKHEIRRYKDPVSMLYILAERNLADLIRIYSQRESCFDIENGRYGPPFFAALATKSSEAVCVLFDIQAQIQPAMSPIRDLCKQYCQEREKWATLGRDFIFSRKRGILSYVVEYGDEILFSFLIELGQYVPDSIDRDNQMLLSWAAKGGNKSIITQLLEKGADVNAATRDGWTPLYEASRNGHVDVAKLLLEKGADVNAATRDGWTPLNRASSNGHVDVAKLLLEKGADVNAADGDGWTPLNEASSNGHVDVAKLLLEKGADVNAATRDGWTPLNRASSNGHVDVAKLLLEKGADVNAADGDGWTPLYEALRNRHVDVAKLLLEKGADVNAATRDGWTPLYVASSNGHVDVAKLLLEKGADVNAATRYGWTPLNVASSNGHVDVAKLLLEKGADGSDS